LREPEVALVNDIQIPTNYQETDLDITRTFMKTPSEDKVTHVSKKIPIIPPLKTQVTDPGASGLANGETHTAAEVNIIPAQQKSPAPSASIQQVEVASKNSERAHTRGQKTPIMPPGGASARAKTDLLIKQNKLDALDDAERRAQPVTVTPVLPNKLGKLKRYDQRHASLDNLSTEQATATVTTLITESGSFP